MKMFSLGHSGSMTFPMTYDFQGEYYNYTRKGWKGLSSLEKSLTVSLGVTSALCVALMIAVIVVGVENNSKETCTGTGVGGSHVTSPTTTIRTPITPPIDRCNTTMRPRPPKRGTVRTTTEITDVTEDDSTTEAEVADEMETTEALELFSSNDNSEDCLITVNNTTICSAPQCFRFAGRIIDSIDFSMEPCLDFYSFACGSWIKNNPVPDYAQNWGQRDLIEEKLLREIKRILEVPTAISSRSLELAKSFYHSCMHPPDNEVVLAEMKLLLEEMVTDENQQDSVPLLLSNIRRSLSGNYIISLDIDVNDEDTEEIAIYLDKPTLGLPSLVKEMGIDSTALQDQSKWHERYQTLAVKLWQLIYPEQGLVEISRIVQFEENLSSISNFTATSPQAAVYDAGLSPSMTSFLSDFVQGVVSNQSIEVSVILRNVEYFKELDTLLNQTDRAVIENYLKLRILLRYGLHAGSALKGIFEEFRTAMKNGVAPSRWRTCSRETNDMFGWALSERILTVFDEIEKEQLNLTVKYLKGAFNETLDSTEWIGLNETRQYAQKKIENLTVHLGFPDWWHDKSREEDVRKFVEAFYSDLNFTDNTNYFQNYIEGRMWMEKKRIGEFLRENRTMDWPKFDFPTKMEDYYAEKENYIVLPVGVMDRSSPLMESSFPSVHYGSLGVMLAQNMMQSLILKGRQREIEGNLGQWWDNETMGNYETISNCFKEQVDEESRLEKTILYSSALSIAYQAYYSQTFEQNYGEVLLPGLQDYRPEQLLFLSFAQSQCSSGQEGRRLVESVLRNSAYFAKHWNCPLPGEKRCKLV